MTEEKITLPIAWGVIVEALKEKSYRDSVVDSISLHVWAKISHACPMLDCEKLLNVTKEAVGNFIDTIAYPTYSNQKINQP